jgi:hypothetical protein
MANRLIFISCGQLTEAEKSLGVLIKTVVDGTPGFQAYFAETVHDLDSLAHHVMEGIQKCAGAIVVLQDRGIVTHSDGTEWGHRSSVWVNQEVAILAYRQSFESKKLPVLAFVDPAVKLEGAMTSLIINPQPLPPAAQFASSVSAWLTEGEFAESSNEVFMPKWEQLTEPARKVVAVLFDEGGKNAKQSAVRQAFAKRFSTDANAADQALRDAKLQFNNTDLVKLIQNIHSGDELSVNPTWEFQLRKQCDKWLRGEK